MKKMNVQSMIDDLQRKLDEITGDDPVSNARRMEIITQINELMIAQENA